MSYENHRCDGSLKARCSIRRYPAREPSYIYEDGRWHLYKGDYDMDYMTGYLRHIAQVKFCPWCGKEL